MKPNYYFVNGEKMLVALLVALFMGGTGLASLLTAPTLLGAFWVIVAALFAALFFRYGSAVTLDEGGITLRFLWLKRRYFPWDRIREVGILGENVFNRGKQKKTGTLYLYFSPQVLDEAGRFTLGVEWPPRHMIYLRYTEDRLAQVQAHWPGEIALYNVGDLVL